MAKRQSSGGLNRLAGKQIVFSGKFDHGVEDSLRALAEAQQGKVLSDLDGTADYLVLADASAGKTIQKKAATLNGKGAAIQVIDADAFRQLAEPTDAEILELLRSGRSEAYSRLRGPVQYFIHGQPPRITYHSEDLNGAQLKQVPFYDIHFQGCRFVGAAFDNVYFTAAADCDFSKATAEATGFEDVPRSKFHKATLKRSFFGGDFAQADFAGAALEQVTFSEVHRFPPRPKTALAGVSFARATVKSGTFSGLHLTSPNFDGADLTGTEFQQCLLEGATLRGARLRDTVLIGCKLCEADLSNADLTGANLAGADLTGARLAGANLKNANLRGTILDGVDLSAVKNYDAAAAVSGSVGPALKELDALQTQARRIRVTFRVRSSPEDEGEEVGIDSSGLRYGWGAIGPHSIMQARMSRGRVLSFSDAMLELANLTAPRQIRFETLEVSSTKSPKGGKELRELLLRGIAEAFLQEPPDDEQLAAATKEYRNALRQQGAAERERRAQAKAAAEKEKAKADRQIARKVAKAVGTVNDVASFLKALSLRIDKPKIDKATSMLKAAGFKLFNDISDEQVSGVVKSQTDPDLVYACRLSHDGHYACCTQNLNVCGGLRGSICKHLLVLIIGLVQAGELDPNTIDAWIAKTHAIKPELDREIMGAIFIKYKGAEAGEVDWRPTETVPEDYYAL